MVSTEFMYMLDEDNVPVPTGDIEAWGKFMGGTERQVGFDKVGKLLVSTVFLGTHHRGGMFETMVFKGEQPIGGTWRYANWDLAKENHERVVAVVLKAFDEGKEWSGETDD